MALLGKDNPLASRKITVREDMEKRKRDRIARAGESYKRK